MNHLTISEAARILIGKNQEGMYPIKLAHLNAVIVDVESEVTRVESLITSTSTGLVEDSLTNGVIDKAPSQNAVYDAIATNLNDAKSYSDSIVLGLLDDRGSFTPSGTYPTTGGSGTAGAIMKGDVWYITGLGSGVTALVGTQEVKDGDTVRALSNTPGQTDVNWDIMSSPVNAITVQTLINSRTEQLTPADADNIPITDGASGNAFKRLTWSGLKSLLSGIFSTKTLVIERKTASYVGEATDNNKLIEMNVGSACTYTVNNSIFSAGDQVLVSQYGAGQVTFVAGAGVTSRSASGKLKLTGQYSMATLIFLSASEFYVAGDLTA